ncbi:MAG TPA: succinylglutamate desuccinylase/aspartoacylase family protein [Rhodanobacteraceae bacterium]
MNMAKDPAIPGVVRITTDVPGPRVVMFSGVHGDEISGIHAVEKLFFDFFTGARTLRTGTRTLARANAEAIAAERRYLKHNLNRMYKDDYGPEIDRNAYEYRRAQELKSILRQCDYFLDLHSAPIAQEPFLIAEQHAIDFFAELGLPYIITGWNKFSGGTTGGDGENYANAHGAKAATLESGSHFEKRSNDVAYRTVVTMLSLLGMIDAVADAKREEAEIIDMYAVVTKEADDFRYVGDVRNFQRLARNEAFAYQGGKPITVAEDSILLIPMKPEETRVHEEVCYLGRRYDAHAREARR